MKRIAALTVAVFLSGSVWAVTPAQWKHSTEAHFAKGKFENAAVSSLGEIVLARQVELLVDCEAAPQVVSAVAVVGQTIYGASGNTPVVLKLEDGEVTQFAELPGAMVNCLLWTGDYLLAGTGGEKAGIYKIDSEGKAEPVWTDKDVKYVWAITEGAAGILYVATGPNAAVYKVEKGIGEIVYQCDETLAKNVLSLAVADGKLSVGTDQTGLVIEIDPGKKTGRILLDSNEREVSAIIPDGNGGLFVATSDAARASADGKLKPNGKISGKLDKAMTLPVVPSPPTQPATAPAVIEESEENTIEEIPADEVGQIEEMMPAGAMSMPIPAEIAEALNSAMSAEISFPSPSSAPPSKKGNAVYHIGSDGLVQTVFRKPVTILAMVKKDNRLFLGTGNGGKIYSVTLDGDEYVELADTDARQITALELTPNGEVIFGSANKGSVGKIQKALADEGTFTSEALDAKQIASWGTARIGVSVPANTKVSFSTRSGNVEKADDKTWSDWSDEKQLDNGFLNITSPAGRFLQYRLKLASSEGNAPVVSNVEMLYQVANLPPKIDQIDIKPSAKPTPQQRKNDSPKVYRLITIKAQDPNKDKLVYNVEFREVGSDGWIKISKKLKQPKYIWDTRKVGDGTYEIRLTASDSASNPPESALETARISDPVVVDNSPPVINDIAVKPSESKACLEGCVADAGSRIVSIHYSVDSQEEWIAVLPSDGIADSDNEEFQFETQELESGLHRIAIRAADLYGNYGYASVSVTIIRKD